MTEHNVFPAGFSDRLKRAAAVGDMDGIDAITLEMAAKGIVRHPGDDSRYSEWEAQKVSAEAARNARAFDAGRVVLDTARARGLVVV